MIEKSSFLYSTPVSPSYPIPKSDDAVYTAKIEPGIVVSGVVLSSWAVPSFLFMRGSQKKLPPTPRNSRQAKRDIIGYP
jgi:hypothetical protein